METKIINLENKQIGKRKLPVQFEEEIRPDLIRRGVLAVQSTRRQPYGAKPGAGLRHSARVSKRRRDWRGSYGIGISRIARKVTQRRGSRFTWTGAISPQAVGGRRAHPPKAEKIWVQGINKKERRKSIRSAIAATFNLELVKQRHSVPESYPFIVSKDIEKLDKTKDVQAFMEKVGFKDELNRAGVKSVRAGKGKWRGRKYKVSKGPLFVVSGECKLLDAAKNIGGVEVVDVKHLNAELLAPGTHAGRLTLWSEAAVDLMEKEKLFI
ncbi:50S ribosomal protein L4 [Candidatus Woesearchaeota archaeon]|nr:50S ribosomal protein L4 [Candidatus Woesearchaeota archaeon]